MKLVSLLPSATEIVYSLGCSKHLVGVSHECDSHPSVRFLKKLTTSKVKDSSSSVKIHQDIQYLLNQSLSVYEVNSELLRTLKPDIIITQSHCSACAVSINQVKDCLVKFLGKKPQLINLNPNNLDGIFNDIKKIGKGLKVNQESSSLISSIKRKFNDTLTKLSAAKSKNVLCIEWLNPIMTAGNWIPQLLYYCKANSIIAQQGVKSKIIDLKKISMEKVDVVIIMPCGFNIERSKCSSSAMVDPKEVASLNAFLNILSALLVRGRCPKVIVPPDVLIISSIIDCISTILQSYISKIL